MDRLALKNEFLCLKKKIYIIFTINVKISRIIYLYRLKKYIRIRKIGRYVQNDL